MSEEERRSAADLIGAAEDRHHQTGSAFRIHVTAQVIDRRKWT